MSSTTPNKKVLVDFLWEWAENHGDWSKLLIYKIVSSESNLSNPDRQIVFNHFLQSINLHTGLTALATTKPTYTPTKKQIELDSLSGITGVNRLAKNQTVNFAKNITVIYGENGTGKTGYSRILKALGFSYDNYNNILPNIYATAEPQSAIINFKANGANQNFTWNGNNSDPELENISVFNSNCVQFSIADRNLIVSPIGFHLFNLVSNELNQLTQLLNSRVASHPTTLAWLENLTLGSPQYNFISTLSASSTEQKLTELSTYTRQNEQELTDKQTELKSLNKALIQTKIQTIRSQVAELGSLIGKIQTAHTLLTSANWQALIDFNKKIVELESKTQTGIKDLADQRGIKFYETVEFNSFIQAAENYIKIIDKPEYPKEGDICVYCLQPLENSAKDLLKSYRTLLNDKTQENLNDLHKQKEELIRRISQIETNLTFHQSTFGVDENQTPIQPKQITDYNKNLGVLKANFTTNNVAQDSVFTFDYQMYIKFLSDKRDALNISLAKKSDVLSNLGRREETLKKEITELKDRKFLLGKVSEVKTAISNHKFVNKLNSNSNSFNTNSISRKTSLAREELVQQDFNDHFDKELASLRKSNLKIELSFGTDRGSSKVYQTINKHALSEILSEGEQKAIALAEFLTELQLDNTKAPVVFDDPVNSLDHKIIEEVARRLLTLSNERQVVVFTHSVLLFNSLLYFTKQPTFNNLNCKFYNSKNEYSETGIITEAAEEINKVKYHISKINVIINNTPKDRPEVEVAEDGYGHLRSAIELLVEHEIFQGTVKRYQKNIALTQFVKVDGVLVNSHKDKLNEIFERSCGFIKGHSNPTEIHNDPTISELETDFKEFNNIRQKFV
ncbi:MAG: AAA family ATPase [Bacteroidetes bacterium]|nr:AAA family ATPase [Bacteroidota bacterium]